MEEKNKNPMQSWLEAQEQMMQLWKDSMENMGQKKESGSSNQAGINMMQNWMETQKNMMEFWQKSISQFQPWKMTNVFAPQDMDAWQNWWQMQQKMFVYWQDAMKSFQPGGSFKSGESIAWGMPTSDMYQDMMKRTAAGYEEFKKMIPTQTGQDTFEKMTQASEVYKNLLSFWENYFHNLPGSDDIEKWKELSSTWVEHYTKILDDFFSVNLPEPFRSFMKSPTEMAELYQEVFFNLFQPWMDASGELQEKYFEAMKGDREAYLNFVRIWQEAYKNSYGKILHIPAFGFNRESMERINASLDSYMEYLSASGNFSAALFQSGNEVMDQLMQEIAELAEKGEAPETFSEFYELWWKTNEKAYFELFKTESFSKILGETVDAWVKFKKRYDDLLDDFISSNLPVPTAKEMDTLYKSVYEMRKAIKEQAKKIEELQKKIDSKSPKGGSKK